MAAFLVTLSLKWPTYRRTARDGCNEYDPLLISIILISLADLFVFNNYFSHLVLFYSLQQFQYVLYIHSSEEVGGFHSAS
jgi:hypothetical protein